MPAAGAQSRNRTVPSARTSGPCGLGLSRPCLQNKNLVRVFGKGDALQFLLAALAEDAHFYSCRTTGENGFTAVSSDFGHLSSPTRAIPTPSAEKPVSRLARRVHIRLGFECHMSFLGKVAIE